MELVLASGSPRRSEILKNAGFHFSVRPSDADETLPADISPDEAVRLLAEKKALSAGRCENEVGLAADTVVAVDGKILGKPSDETDAFSMLRRLSGKTHSVFTGVAVLSGDETRIFSVRTDVTFYELSDGEIKKYIATGEPLDKAGAYGIQGRAAVFVKKINGDYLNVVGLPLAEVSRALKAFGIFAE